MATFLLFFLATRVWYHDAYAMLFTLAGVCAIRARYARCIAPDMFWYFILLLLIECSPKIYATAMARLALLFRRHDDARRYAAFLSRHYAYALFITPAAWYWYGIRARYAMMRLQRLPIHAMIIITTMPPFRAAILILLRYMLLPFAATLRYFLYTTYHRYGAPAARHTSYTLRHVCFSDMPTFAMFIYAIACHCRYTFSWILLLALSLLRWLLPLFVAAADAIPSIIYASRSSLLPSLSFTYDILLIAYFDICHTLYDVVSYYAIAYTAIQHIFCLLFFFMFAISRLYAERYCPLSVMPSVCRRRHMPLILLVLLFHAAADAVMPARYFTFDVLMMPIFYRFIIDAHLLFIAIADLFWRLRDSFIIRYFIYISFYALPRTYVNMLIHFTDVYYAATYTAGAAIMSRLLLFDYDYYVYYCLLAWFHAFLPWRLHFSACHSGVMLYYALRHQRFAASSPSSGAYRYIFIRYARRHDAAAICFASEICHYRAHNICLIFRAGGLSMLLYGSLIAYIAVIFVVFLAVAYYYYNIAYDMLPLLCFSSIHTLLFIFSSYFWYYEEIAFEDVILHAIYRSLHTYRWLYMPLHWGHAHSRAECHIIYDIFTYYTSSYALDMVCLYILMLCAILMPPYLLCFTLRERHAAMLLLYAEPAHFRADAMIIAIYTFARWCSIIILHYATPIIFTPADISRYIITPSLMSFFITPAFHSLLVMMRRAAMIYA